MIIFNLLDRLSISIVISSVARNLEKILSLRMISLEKYM